MFRRLLFGIGPVLLSRNEILIRNAGPVTLIGGGPVRQEEIIAATSIAQVIVAADGGGDVSLPPGARLCAVIGDLDSLRDPAALRDQGVAVHAVAEQDSTDLEKCLYSIDTPLFIGVGFLGGRVDHTLAALNALVKNPDKAVVLIGSGDLCFLCPEEFDLVLPRGARVSLFPMAEVVGKYCEGLRWSVEGLDMAPDRRIGTSNIALGGSVRFSFDRRRVIVVLPAEFLPEVVAMMARG